MQGGLDEVLRVWVAGEALGRSTEDGSLAKVPIAEDRLGLARCEVVVLRGAFSVPGSKSGLESSHIDGM